MRKRLTENDLVARGLEKVNAGAYASKAAKELLQAWGTIDDAAKRAMAEVGLATMISDAVLRQRRDREFAAASEERKAANDATRTRLAPYGLTMQASFALHKRLNCPVMQRHGNKEHDAHGCVIHLLGDVLQQKNKNALNKAILKIAAQHQKEIEEYEKDMAEPIGTKITRLFDEVVGKSLKGIMLACDDGMRSLFDFRLKDARTWAQKAKNHAAGWARRAEWFDRATTAMTDAKVSEMAKLPPGVLGRLAREAETVWREDLSISVQRRKASR